MKKRVDNLEEGMEMRLESVEDVRKMKIKGIAFQV